LFADGQEVRRFESSSKMSKLWLEDESSSASAGL
jgi:hypothetical protein